MELENIFETKEGTLQHGDFFELQVGENEEETIYFVEL